jgi:hypothetical protein
MTSLSYAPVPSSKPNPGSCYTTSMPRYAAEGAPARMADGRIFSDYRPKCASYPVAACGTWGDNETRKRMTHGATELMNASRSIISAKVAPSSCVDTMVPELYKRVCTWQGCKTIPGHYAGLGTGRVYVPSSAGADPVLSSKLNVPPIPGTFSPVSTGIPNNCYVPDVNTIVESRDRTRLYSAPRSF